MFSYFARFLLYTFFFFIIKSPYHVSQVVVNYYLLVLKVVNNTDFQTKKKNILRNFCQKKKVTIIHVWILLTKKNNNLIHKVMNICVTAFCNILKSKKIDQYCFFFLFPKNISAFFFLAISVCFNFEIKNCRHRVDKLIKKERTNIYILFTVFCEYTYIFYGN